MRGVTFILLLTVFVLSSCNPDSVKKSDTEKIDTVKQLDWEKTANEQRLKIVLRQIGFTDAMVETTILFLILMAV